MFSSTVAFGFEADIVSIWSPVAVASPVKLTTADWDEARAPVHVVEVTGPLSICALMTTEVKVCKPLFLMVTTGVKPGLQSRCEGLLMFFSCASTALRTTGWQPSEESRDER